MFIGLKVLMSRNTKARFLVTYISVALIVMVSILPLYRIAVENTRRIYVQEQTLRVTNGYNSALATLNSCRISSYNLANRPEITRLSMCSDDDPRLPLYLYNALRMIQSQIWTEPILMDIVIQFPSNSVVVTTSRVFTEKLFFYDKFMSYGGMSYDEWQQSVASQSAGWVDEAHFYGGNKAGTLTLNQYITPGTQPSVYVSAVINMNMLVDMVATEDIRLGGRVDIAVLGITYSQGAEADANAGDVIIRIPEGRDAMLGLTCVLPGEGVASETRPLLATLQTYICLAVLSSLILSILYTFINSRPLDAVMRYIRQVSAQSGGAPLARYQSINSAIHLMEEDRSAMKKEYDEVKSAYMHAMLDAALRGGPVPEELRSMLCELPAFSGEFILAAFAAEGGVPLTASETEAYRRAAAERFAGAFEHNGGVRLFVLDIRAQGGVEQLIQKLHEINAELDEKGTRKLQFGLSNGCGSVDNLAQAYGEACHALRCAQQDGTEAACFSGGEAQTRTVVNRALLTNALMRGDEPGLLRLFAQWRRESSLNPSAINDTTVYYNVLSVCHQLTAQLPSPGAVSLHPYRPELTAAENILALEGHALVLQREMHKHKSRHKENMLNDIVSYIQANFRSPELSLSSLAEHAGLSERYLSAMLRERTGLSYIEYVDMLRMGEAQRLLETTDVSVSEVGMLSGYSRDNTFFKAFKRCTGLSPTAYREASRLAGGSPEAAPQRRTDEDE